MVAVRDLDRSVTEAVAALQDGMEHVTGEIPYSLYDAMGAVAVRLLHEGHVMAAMAHLWVQMALSDEGDDEVRSFLVNLLKEPRVPLLLKEIPRLVDHASTFDGGDTFREAMRLAHRANWRAARQRFQALAAQHPDDLGLLRNISILSICLADNDSAVFDLRRVAQHPDMSLDEAVEFEALAQALRPNRQHLGPPIIERVYPLSDVEAIQERLLSDRRFVPDPTPQYESDEENPPPRAAYYFVNRPMPTTAEGLADDAFPTREGNVALFGRQTDRPGRIEFLYVRDPWAAPSVQEMDAFVQPQLAGEITETVAGELDPIEAVTRRGMVFPSDVSPEVQQACVKRFFTTAVLEHWGQVEQPALGDRRPLDLVDDAASRVPLLACVLALELDDVGESVGFDYNDLRRRLKLPESQRWDPRAVPFESIPVYRWQRMDVSRLHDDELLRGLARVLQLGQMGPAQPLSSEILARPTLAGQPVEMDAHMCLATRSRDHTQAIEHFSYARRLAARLGRPTTDLLFAEMIRAGMAGDGRHFDKLVREVMASHSQVPGVRERLLGVFQMFGLLSDESRPAAGAAPVEALVGSAAGEDPSIWTPDAPAGGGEKSKLWLPGQE